MGTYFEVIGKQPMTHRTDLLELASVSRRSLGPGMPRDERGEVQSAGTCLYASLVFMMLMRRFNADLGIAVIRGGEKGARDVAGLWHGHYWVEVDCNGERFVVDVTADQFGYKPVVVLPWDEAAERYRPGPQAEADGALTKALEDLGCGDLLAA